jgi:hypothetical protein
MAVLDAWENGLSSESFTKVCNRLQNILALIVEDKGGNAETLWWRRNEERNSEALTCLKKVINHTNIYINVTTR